MTSDPKTFREVYRHAFILGKEGEARAVTLDMATMFWQILFKEPGRPWVGRQTGLDWLSQWLAFLSEKWTRTVSKDMWNQTYEFAAKSIEDESLSFWSEDGAWPGVIDQFVAWYREKKATTEDMDVDS
jgi:DCN1-like protein 1/2